MNPKTKSIAVIGALLGGVGLMLYPIVIDPIISTDTRGKYLADQKEVRKFQKERGNSREDIQPGGMKVWSDPFDPNAAKKKAA